jgi:RNA polymerase-binding protein DksA
MALDLEKYRKRLLEEQAKLNEDLGPVGELSEPTPDDRQITAANAPIIAEVQDVQNRVLDIKSNRMAKINAALQSIDDGTYGTCIKCGKEIDPRRLDAEPMAMTCIECAEKESNIETPTM